MWGAIKPNLQRIITRIAINIKIKGVLITRRNITVRNFVPYRDVNSFFDSDCIQIRQKEKVYFVSTVTQNKKKKKTLVHEHYWLLPDISGFWFLSTLDYSDINMHCLTSDLNLNQLNPNRTHIVYKKST